MDNRDAERSAYPFFSHAIPASPSPVERDSSQQLQYDIRTFPVRFSGIRGTGIGNTDLSLLKTFRLTEKFKPQFRPEGQNAGNHPVFPTTNTSPGVQPVCLDFRPDHARREGSAAHHDAARVDVVKRADDDHTS